jgi:Mrp family chromosome partitioning ATPase
MLKITISGKPGAGKTTIASEIAALLQSLDMNVTIVDFDLVGGDSLHNLRSDEVHQASVEAMAGRSVVIQTVQERKS